MPQRLSFDEWKSTFLWTRANAMKEGRMVAALGWHRFRWVDVGEERYGHGWAKVHGYLVPVTLTISSNDGFDYVMANVNKIVYRGDPRPKREPKPRQPTPRAEYQEREDDEDFTF